jgi:hypothetical protein
MADNFSGLDSNGDPVVLATNEIGGAHFPLSKFGFGVSGSFTYVSAADPLPVALPLNTLSMVPDDHDPGIVVRPVGQYTWACSFADVGANVLTPDFRAPDVGTGVGYSQAAGSLLITAGTTANKEFLTRSLESWRGALQMRYSLIASQRVANTNLAIMLADLVGENLAVTVNSATSITVALPDHEFTALNIGQFMFVGGITGVNGVPGRYAIASVVDGVSINLTVAGWPGSGSGTVDLFGHSHVKHLYTGTTATNVAADAQRKGWASGDTTLTILTTASPGHIMQAHCAGREVYWSDMLRASTATPNVTMRGSRVENIPDDDLDLYLFIWSYNGTTNPASSTTWTIGFVSVEKFAPTPVYVQGQEMQGSAAPAPVAVQGTVPVSGSVTVSGTVTSTVAGGTVNPVVPATPYFLNSAATTNGNLIITGTSGLQAFYATNEGASVAYVKLYNKATAPTVGTDVPEMTIPIPAAVGGVPGVSPPIDPGFSGFRFALGLGIAITRNAVYTDTTAVGSGEVKVKLSRTV